jgi:hypothetical protein
MELSLIKSGSDVMYFVDFIFFVTEPFEVSSIS